MNAFDRLDQAREILAESPKKALTMLPRAAALPAGLNVEYLAQLAALDRLAQCARIGPIAVVVSDHQLAPGLFRDL